MGSIRSIDVVSEGFGGSAAAFAAVVVDTGRMIRIIRASRARVAITGIDVNFFINGGQALSTSRAHGVLVTVFRQSASNPFPDTSLVFFTLASRNLPAGVECLFAQNVTGICTTSAAGNGNWMTNLSQNSFTFAPGSIFADAGQVLVVVVAQPTPLDAGASCAGNVVLSVAGFDYGDAGTAHDSINPTERSYPRYNLRT